VIGDSIPGRLGVNAHDFAGLTRRGYPIPTVGLEHEIENSTAKLSAPRNIFRLSNYGCALRKPALPPYVYSSPWRSDDAPARVSGNRWLMKPSGRYGSTIASGS
jgi:hypothetical protein